MHTLPPVAEVRHDEAQDMSLTIDRNFRICELQRSIAALEERILAEEFLLHPKNPKNDLPPNSHHMIEETEFANKNRLQALKTELNELQSQEGADQHVVEMRGSVTSSVTGLL